MNLVERLNARFNNVIHDGLALVGAVVDPWLAKLERQAMSNALGRDIGLDYGDVLVAVEAEEEVHEPSVGHRVSADSLSTAVGDIGPGAGMVPPPPPAPGPSKCTCPTVECELLAEDICDEAEEAELLDEFMELGEFLDSATAEELAAMRQQHATAAELERHLRYFTTAPGASGVNPGVVAQSLLENYRITPR
ncbi:hypothetical protein FGG23_gp053 [Mycobacterium phage Ibhubesi]|uniref:Uncharacterized protein n=1 Tax=Mycobacterium phage Ibhubesi TaxID=2922205 RepID=G1D2Z9_9CAUD|nr:hypothetical protein FGG23_gp053 [Mycobacterium phage Ibhubesi]AEK09149.1 hypothetical protein PBI_IBHUBESI_53 [Mycobacterium phage Ibhubesi]